MSTPVRKTNLRWIAPAAAAGLVIASPSLWSAFASAEPPLPPRSADEIIADVIAAEPVAFSGELTQTMNLGLPQLPFDSGVDLSNPDSMWTLASGTNTWRLWYDGEQSYRVSIIRGQSEADLISNGQVRWAWTSQSQTAVRTELPAVEQQTAPEDAGLPAHSPTEAAKQLLGEVEQYSTVETDSNVRVAGRAAYELIITPSDDQSLVGELRVAVDAETALPLRVLVYSTQSTSPAAEFAFTKINYGVPNASTFEFTPPPGAEVIEATGPQAIEDAPGTTEQGSGTDQGPGTELPAAPGQEPGLPEANRPGRVIVGEGWSQILVTEPLGSGTESVVQNPVLAQLPRVSGDWGSGVVLDGTLISVVLADDGRIAAGAVPASSLYEALGK